MYLYDKKDNSFIVYEMIEKEIEIQKYRFEELQKFKNTLTKCEYSIYSYSKYFPEIWQKPKLPDLVFNKEFNKIFHVRAGEILKVLEDKLIEELAMPNFKKRVLFRYFNEKTKDKDSKVRYFISSFNYMDFVEIPKSLYILYLLENEKFKRLKPEKIYTYRDYEKVKQNNNIYFNPKNKSKVIITNEKDYIEDYSDIRDQIKLFNINRVNEIEFDKIKLMDSCGITKNAFPRILKKSETDSVVLNSLKYGCTDNPNIDNYTSITQVSKNDGPSLIRGKNRKNI